MTIELSPEAPSEPGIEEMVLLLAAPHAPDPGRITDPIALFGTNRPESAPLVTGLGLSRVAPC